MGYPVVQATGAPQRGVDHDHHPRQALGCRVADDPNNLAPGERLPGLTLKEPAMDALFRFHATGVALIAAERQRQIDVEGWTPEHDTEHDDGNLAMAAVCYALPPTERRPRHVFSFWPWHSSWWKPTPDDRVRELVKAGALIAAEIDRLRALSVARAEALRAAEDAVSTDLHTENCDPEFGCDETCTTPLPPDEAARCVLALADELESFTVNRDPAPGSYDAGVVAAFVNIAARIRAAVAGAR